jgi:beta-galactosidase
MLLAATHTGHQSLQAQRQMLPLLHNWTYQMVQDQVMRYPPQQVQLPHTFNADETYQGPNYTRGTALYEHKLADTLRLNNKKVFLRFESVNSQATVLVNGRTADQHTGGYTAFSLEITHLNKDGGNTLQVLVSNAYSTEILPLSGDFNVYGGIHRPVWLLPTEQDCISPLHYGTSGVYIKTPQVSESVAKIQVETKLSLLGNKTLSLLVELKDANGKVVAHKEKKVKANNATTTFTLAKPRLWNGKAEPYLYTAQVSLVSNGQTIDGVAENFGLRYYSVDAAKGLILNGKYLDLHGVCRHEDVARRGSALLPQDHATDMELALGDRCHRHAPYPLPSQQVFLPPGRCPWHGNLDRNTFGGPRWLSRPGLFEYTRPAPACPADFYRNGVPAFQSPIRILLGPIQ